jgi:hypothetical protein
VAHNGLHYHLRLAGHNYSLKRTAAGPHGVRSQLMAAAAA